MKFDLEAIARMPVLEKNLATKLEKHEVYLRDKAASTLRTADAIKRIRETKQVANN